MRSGMIVALLVAVLVTALLLNGCPKKEQAQLQGAPEAGAPPTHTMPGGEQMPGAAMPPEGKAAGPTHTMPGGQQMPGATHPGTPEGAKAADTAATSTKAGDSSEMASCPVLGTTMKKSDMIPYQYKGKTYYFCCQPCVEKFKADPEKYLKNPAPPKPAGEGMH